MLKKIVPTLALGLLIALLALVPAAVAQDDTTQDDAAQARKDKILANLILKFPQLEEMNATMGELKASEFEGLDVGTFTLSGPRGSQTQKFFVTSDDTQLYFINEPLDVSRSAEQIAAEMAAKEAEAAKAAIEKRKELEGAIHGLPTRGNPDAKVTIVEFSDFQCPYCQRGAGTVKEIIEKHGENVKVVFMHYPLGFHPWAKPAAIAASCAGKQDEDAFWTLHDKYFASQKQLTPENVVEKSKEFLSQSELEIDLAAWSRCAGDKESEEHQEMESKIEAEMAFGSKLGVSGTPGFFVNGRFLNGAQPLAAFEPLIQEALEDPAI